MMREDGTKQTGRVENINIFQHQKKEECETEKHYDEFLYNTFFWINTYIHVNLYTLSSRLNISRLVTFAMNIEYQ